MGAKERYDSANTKQFKMKLNIKTDADIIEWLDTQDNKQGAVKDLIRNAINAAGLKLIEGSFLEGETVKVNVHGKTVSRKVRYDASAGDLYITCNGNKYFYYEF